jgi:hypothetical protein
MSLDFTLPSLSTEEQLHIVENVYKIIFESTLTHFHKEFNAAGPSKDEMETIRLVTFYKLAMLLVEHNLGYKIFCNMLPDDDKKIHFHQFPDLAIPSNSEERSLIALLSVHKKEWLNFSCEKLAKVIPLFNARMFYYHTAAGYNGFKGPFRFDEPAQGMYRATNKIIDKKLCDFISQQPSFQGHPCDFISLEGNSILRC